MYVYDMISEVTTEIQHYAIIYTINGVSRNARSLGCERLKCIFQV